MVENVKCLPKKFAIKMIVIGLISAFVAIYCMLFNTNTDFDAIFLLPLSFGIFVPIAFMVLKGCFNYTPGIVMSIAYSIITIRYAITPLMMVLTQNQDSWGWGPNPNVSSMNEAVILMIIELAVTLLIHFCVILWTQEKSIIAKNKGGSGDQKWKFIGIVAIIFSIVVLYTKPELLIPTNLFSYGEDAVSSAVENMESFQGVIVMMADLAKKLILIVILIICKTQYDTSRNKIYADIAGLGILLNLLMNFGGTRIRMVFSLVLGVYFLKVLFGRVPKIIVFMGIVALFVFFIEVTSSKFSYALGDKASTGSTIKLVMGQFQDYFAGPRLIAQMINMKSVGDYHVTMSTFMNDILGSVPFVSNFIDQGNRINFYFNSYNGMSNQTLIAPVLGISYYYFPWFPFMLTALFEGFVAWFDHLVRFDNRIGYKYTFAYMGYVFAMCMGYSTQNIFAQLFNAFIPLLIILWLNDRMSFGFVRYKNVATIGRR